MPLLDPAGIGNALASGLFGWLTGGVAPMLSLLGGILSSTGSTDLIIDEAGVFVSRIRYVVPLIALLSVALGVLQSLTSSSMRRTAVFAAVGVFVACVTLKCAHLILITCDAVTSLVTPGTAQHIRSVSQSLGLSGVSPTAAVIGTICLFAGLILCFELLMRSLILVLLICVIPLVAAGMAWAPARHLTLRCVEIFIGVTAAKFVVEFTLVIGLTMLDQSPGISALLLSATTLILAGCMPLVVLRLFPLSLGGAAQQFDGVRQRLTRASLGVTQHPGVSAIGAVLPASPPPAAPKVSDDLGLEMWPGSGSSAIAPKTSRPPRIPVVPARVPRRPIIGRDHLGPRIEWEWDDE